MNNLYRTAFKQSLTAYLIVSGSDDKIIADANSAACEFFGYQKDEITKLNYNQLFLTGLDVKLSAGEKSFAATGIHKNGDQIICRCQISSNEQSDGSKALLLQVTERTTAPKGKKGQKLHISLLESVVTNTREAVLITNASSVTNSEDPEIIYVNDAFTKLTGYEQEEVIGKTPRILQGLNTESEELQKLRDAIKNQKSTVVELINYKKSGEEFWVNISLNPVFDGNGHCTHFIAIERDITARKYREQLKSLESDISRIFNEQESVNDSIEDVLQVIAEFGKFSLAEIWLVNEDKSSMGLTGYYDQDKSVELFYSESNRVQFRKGEGMPGITWKTGELQFWQNLKIHENFQRRDAIKSINNDAAYCVPVIYHGEVIGALLLGVREAVASARYNRSLLIQLGEDLGSEINRKKLEEELNRTFNFSPDVICISGMDGYLKKVNPAMCRLLGYTQDELLSHPISTFTHPDDRIRTEAEIDAINQDKGSPKFENRFITKTGKIIWLSWTTNTVYDEGKIYSIARDITERKELENILKQANRLAKIGSWSVDLVEETNYWSEITKEIHEVEPDYEPDIHSGINFYKEGESRERIRAAVENAIEKGVPYDIEVQIITAKGNELWVRTIGEPEMVDGKCVRFYGSIQDINEEKELENLLERAHRLSKIGTWELDLVNKKIYWSDMMYDIFEVNSRFEPTVENNIEFYKEGESREEMWDVSQQAINEGSSWDIEVQIVTKNGNERWVRSIGDSEFQEGKCVRLYGSLQDINQRKEAELASVQASEELSRVFTSAPDGIIIAGFDGYFKKVNPAMCEMLGYTESELLSTPLLEFIHPEDKEDTLNQFEAIDRRESNHFYENRYITKSGKVLWLAWSSRIFFDEKIAYCVVKDVTEEKELELLHEQATRLARIGSWEVDLVEDKMYWADITREIHEVGPEFEPELDTAISFYKEGKSRKKITEAVTLAIEKGISYDLELQIVTAKGNERWVRAIGEPELVGGKCVRLYGSFQDIHQRKKAELAFVQASEERDKILQSITDAFYAIDEDWNLTYFNHEAESLLGRKAKDVLGKNIWIEFAPAAETELYDIYHEVMEEKKPASFEYYYPPLESWFDISAYPAENGISVYFKNIDERKKTQQQILNKTRQLDVIASFNSQLIKKDDWRRALNECLGEFGELADADRVYYFANDTDKKPNNLTTSMVLEWVREGISPELENPVNQNLRISEIPSLMDTFFEREFYHQKEGDLTDTKFKTFLQRQGIKSILKVPVFANNKFRGFIGFDDCTKERNWSEEVISFLETIAINLASAIENEDAELALQQAFTERNEILESIGDAFFTLDKNWTVTYWNYMAEKVLNMPRERILGENLWDLYEDATSLEFYTQYHKAVNEQVTVHFEEYYPSYEKWFEVSAYPSSSGLSVYFKDITERKRNQVKLLEKTRQLDAIARFNSLLIKKDHWIEALDDCLAMFGKVAGTDRVYYFECHQNGSAGQHVISMRAEWAREGIKPEMDNPGHHDLPLADIRPVTEVLAERKTFNRIVKDIDDREFREFLLEQEIKSLLAIPVFTGDTFRGFIGFDDCTKERIWSIEEISFLETITINLTSAIENEDTEIALQQAFNERNEILESIGDAFFAVDNEWTVTYWNKVAEKLLNMPREQIVGASLWDLFDDPTSLEFYREFHNAIENQVTVHFDEFYAPINKWFEVNAYPSASGLSAYLRDITDRKESESRLTELNRSLEKQAKELAASNAELEQFAFIASHDLQEPLRMITSFLALLEKKYSDQLDENAKKYIYFATDGAKRMRQIILELLNFSRVGRLEIEKTEVDINEVLRDVYTLSKKNVEAKNATLSWNNMPTIYAEESSVKRLFNNLVSNALKYHKEDTEPRINIDAEEKDQTWEISVKDNGIGINPEYHQKIFNIFQRLHTNEEYSGTGIGLAICKKIVEMHGGEIWVESQVGEGSTFKFTIPKI